MAGYLLAQHLLDVRADLAAARREAWRQEKRAGSTAVALARVAREAAERLAERLPKVEAALARDLAVGESVEIGGGGWRIERVA